MMGTAESMLWRWSGAQLAANGMGTVCKGAPARWRSNGGMWGQFQKLIRGCHPKTGDQLDNHTNADGTPWRPGKVIYANLKKGERQGEGPGDEQFYEYIPEEFAAATPLEGRSAKAKAGERRLRIVAKEKAKASVRIVPVTEVE